MRIANIYPVKNQELYKNETYVMILAHLLKYYKKDSFNSNAYVICDNGLYEESQVSTDLQKLIDLIESYDVTVNEIIVPDVVNDLDATIKLFEANLETIKKYQNKYKFMFVAQSRTYEQLRRAVSYINSYDLNLSIGISKLTPLDRGSYEAIEIYKTAKHPIHFLGLKTSFGELLSVMPYIRGCDSSQLAYIVKNEKEAPRDFMCYMRKGRREDGRGIDGVDIDLEHDELSSLRLAEYKNYLWDFRSYLERYEDFVALGASSKYDKKLAIIGLVGEVGEISDVVKKETIYEDMHKFEQKYGMSVSEKARDELGDAFWQFTLLATKYHLSLKDIIDTNIEKLTKRHGGVTTAKDGGSR